MAFQDSQRSHQQEKFFSLLGQEFKNWEVQVKEGQHFITIIKGDHIPDENFKAKVSGMFSAFWGFEYELLNAD